MPKGRPPGPSTKGINRAAPTLRPEECTQRAAQVAVDMCLMNTQYFITLSHFMGRHEIFHCQMHLLYGLIDTMGATANVDPETVLGLATSYFQRLRSERNRIEHNETDQQPSDE